MPQSSSLLGDKQIQSSSGFLDCESSSKGHSIACPIASHTPSSLDQSSHVVDGEGC